MQKRLWPSAAVAAGAIGLSARSSAPSSSEGSYATSTTSTAGLGTAPDGTNSSAVHLPIPSELDTPAKQAFAQRCSACHVSLDGELDPELVQAVRAAVDENDVNPLVEFVLEGNLQTAEGLFQPGFEGQLTALEIEANLRFVASVGQSFAASCCHTAVSFPDPSLGVTSRRERAYVRCYVRGAHAVGSRLTAPSSWPSATVGDRRLQLDV